MTMSLAFRGSALSAIFKQAGAGSIACAGTAVEKLELLKPSNGYGSLASLRDPAASIILSTTKRSLVTGSLAHRRMARSKNAALETLSSKTRKIVPTKEIAANMPLRPSEMGNHELIALSALEHHAARCEVLKRHVMVVDDVAYEQAEETFERIKESNRRGMKVEALPYQIGIVAATTGAFVSFPMCFHFETVHTFNEIFVTADVPEPKDLETALEVGAWAWNWVEPVLGQLSFFLICMQYSRSQLQNLGIKPFTSQLKRRRARRLSKEFPEYDEKVMSDFSETDNLWRP